MKVQTDLKVKGKKVVYLYLTDWQMRMVKDFLGIECDGMEIPVEDAGSVLKYGVFPPEKEIVKKRMYLTDWQCREMRDEAGAQCDYVELTKDITVFRYGVPTE
ncbi:MAG: hypothetical protein PVH88_18305 [Ignavibacteria bacterium]